jgi:hypothetical protein
MKSALLFLTVLSLGSPAWAQDEVFDENDVQDVLNPEQSRILRDGWKRLRGEKAVLPAPTVAVVVGYVTGGKIVSQETAMEKVTRADLRAQLAAQGVTVVSEEALAKGMKSLDQALRERAGEDAALATAELLNEFTAADVLVQVELVPVGTGEAKRLFRVVDARTRPATILFEESFNEHPTATPTASRRESGNWMIKMRRGTTLALAKLGENLMTRDPYMPVYRVQALDLPSSDFEKWSRAIRQAQRPGLRMVRTPVKLSRTGASVTPLWLEFSGEWFVLQDVLAEAAEKSTGRSMVKVFDSGAFDFIVSLQSAMAGWERFVGKDALPPAERIGPLLSRERKPTVAILYGQDTDAPVAAVADERETLPRLTLNEETVSRVVGRHFIAAGFEVKDAAAVRRQIENQIERANLGKNLSGMRTALRDSNATDFLVLMRADPTTGELALTVLNARGAQVAFCHYPDQKVRLYENFVDVRDVESLTRYLSASLFEQMYAQIEDASALSIEVVLKNTRNAQQAMDVAAAFRSIEGVKSVTDLKIDQPIARFTVNTSGNSHSLVQKAAELAAKKQLGAKGIVEFANEQQIVLNILPAWFTEFDTEKEPEVVRPPNSAPPTPSPVPLGPAPVVIAPSVAPVAPATPSLPAPATVTPAQRGSMEETMRAVRDSVWVVGFDLPSGEFQSIGTAWTVGPRLLATNAHVLIGDGKAIDLEDGALTDQAEKYKREGIAARPVARNGDHLSNVIPLDLDQAQAHPAYEEFGNSYSGRLLQPYDVALIATKADAGRPLPLASTAKLTALEPLNAIGYCGYPAENRLGGGRSQQMLVGTINAMTTVFLQDTTIPADRRIVHFSLPAAGGASGSPIMAADGSVVALLSAGDVIGAAVRVSKDSKGDTVVGSTDKRRVPIGFTYGQRVDMLAELIDNRVDLPAVRQAWQREFKTVAEQLNGRN